MLFDTTFLIDYEREVRRSRPGLAHGFLVTDQGGGDRAHVPRLQSLRREMLQVAGHDQFRVAADGRSQNVPVLLVIGAGRSWPARRHPAPPGS